MSVLWYLSARPVVIGGDKSKAFHSQGRTADGITRKPKESRFVTDNCRLGMNSGGLYQDSGLSVIRDAVRRIVDSTNIKSRQARWRTD